MSVDISLVRHPEHLFIGGHWVPASSGQVFDLVSPDSGNLVGQVAEANEVDVDLAVQAAKTAFEEGPWPGMAVADRVALLIKLTECLKARKADLVEALRLQVGVSPGLGDLLNQWGIDSFERAIALGDSFAFEQQRHSDIAAAAYVVHEPVGVVVAIAPWNAPLMSMAAKVAPALLAGCTVVMKPSPETPLETYILAECAEQAGLPPGVVNLVTAGREASDHLVANRDVDKIAFTGSTAVGRRIAQVCGERIARYTLELGGKSAALLLDDMDDAQAAKILARTICIHSGQVCATLSRAIVPRARHDALAAAIAAEMASIPIGRSDDPDAEMGPLAMRRQLDRVEEHVARGIAEGATLICGGRRPAAQSRGYFFEPTLFANVTPSMALAQEEIFGPVLALMPCDSLEEGIRIANSTIYGLNGSVLTHDAEAAYQVARQLRTGGIAQNGLRNDLSLPFGGYRQSGIGREGGEQGLMHYLETKTILLDGACP